MPRFVARATRVVAALAALAALSACTQVAAPQSGVWSNIHDGRTIGNIYTGDDHI
jgi:hypothetical protein